MIKKFLRSVSMPGRSLFSNFTHLFIFSFCIWAISQTLDTEITFNMMFWVLCWWTFLDICLWGWQRHDARKQREEKSRELGW